MKIITVATHSQRYFPAPADVSMKNIVSHLGYDPVRYSIMKRAWKYLYSIYAFWGSKSFKKVTYK